MLKKLLAVFILAFVLNWIWEILHSPLYVHYQSGEITSFILFRAALGDAAIIAILLLITQKYKWLFVMLALLVAVVMERWALSTGRWAYTAAMPIIPIIGAGLTPTIQLAITGLLAKKIVKLAGH